MESNQTHHEAAATVAITPAPLSSSKKMGKLRASYLLAIEGLELLKKDKQVLLFPALSALASLAVLVVFCILYWILGGEMDSSATDGSHGLSSLGYGGLLLLYLALAFVATFFQAGLTAIVHARINGRSMTFKEGMNTAKAHTEKIFLWSLVSATVGVILAFISNRSKWLGKIVSGLLGAAWGIITFFIVPALVLEEGNVQGAIKSSADTFKKTWGETIVVNFGAGFFFFLAALSGILLSVLLAVLGATILPSMAAIPFLILLVIILIIFLIGTAVLSVTINSIFRVVLYEYAKSGHMADTFAPELILGALKKKEG